MKNGDKIIWDSGFGYDLGIFKNEKGVVMNTVLVDLKTGRVGGIVSITASEVYPYTEELCNQLKSRYGYSRQIN